MTFANDLEALTAVASVKATKDDLLQFVRKLSVDIPGVPNGSVTVLYTGKIGGANAYEFVNDMPADVRRLDERAMATRLLNSDEFKMYGGEGKDMLWGGQSVDNLQGDKAEDPQAWGADYVDGEKGKNQQVPAGSAGLRMMNRCERPHDRFAKV